MLHPRHHQHSGLSELVYNDFYVGDDCDVDIIAGCGIHNSGCDESRHDGIHTFHIGKIPRSAMWKSTSARKTPARPAATS